MALGGGRPSNRPRPAEPRGGEEGRGEAPGQWAPGGRSDERSGRRATVRSAPLTGALPQAPRYRGWMRARPLSRPGCEPLGDNGRSDRT